MRYDDASQAGSTSDSAPVARADIDSLAPGSMGPASGNVISGAGTETGASGADTVGDAPAKVVELRGAGSSDDTGNTLQASGQYGTLSMDADGSYNYVRNAGSPESVQD
ncbi:MAG: VCBS domain-containing protein, partial [Sphingomicrobium sp.]